jgi:hypothetical protein
MPLPILAALAEIGGGGTVVDAVAGVGTAALGYLAASAAKDNFSPCW